MKFYSKFICFANIVIPNDSFDAVGHFSSPCSRGASSASVCLILLIKLKETSDFAYELLCDIIAKAAITTFSFFVSPAVCRLGSRWVKPKVIKTRILVYWIWICELRPERRNKKVAADSGFFGSLTQKSEHTHKPEIYSVRGLFFFFWRWYNLFLLWCNMLFIKSSSCFQHFSIREGICCYGLFAKVSRAHPLAVVKLLVRPFSCIFMSNQPVELSKQSERFKRQNSHRKK